jgi:NAD-dependent histone deacetylase SIR2
MAAHASEAPIVAGEAVPPPALGVKAEAAAADGATKAKDDDAPAPDQDDDDGGVWDSASLYEEILDEVEAFEYSSDGEPRPYARPPMRLARSH